MNNALLSLEQTPPLAVPLRFMLTAPFLAVLAGLVALFYPEVLVNRWTPAALAVTHLLTLGFISMVMAGALQQLLPVLAGVQLRQSNLFSQVLFVGILIGTLLLCGGFLWQIPLLLGIGAVILVISFLLMIFSLLVALLRSEASAHVTIGMKLALLAFAMTLGLGAWLAAGYSIPAIPLDRELTGLHVRWGIFGWIGLLVITVSYQVVPMFQVTPKYPSLVRSSLSPAIFIILLLMAINHFILGSIWLERLLEAVLPAAFILYAGITLRLQHQRRRKVPDVTLDYWRLGLLALLLAFAVAGLNETNTGLPALEGLIGVLFIAGFALSVINGMLYKIVPFLVWLHLTNTVDMRNRWQLKIPNMKQIIPDHHARRQFRLHAGTLGAVVLSLWLERLSSLASLLFICSNLYLAYNLIQGALVFKRFTEQEFEDDG
ncbi:MAG: hypothetical protein HOC70_08995 [Gammaproteobacteria bacterium]|nr:hypothetical protein [Gammaproteobacteria bacterium]MBT7369541.1 hypothetical protein [Gammaproteobacteria bacterium]